MKLDRDDVDLPITHTALGDQRLGELTDALDLAAQYHGFKTVIVIQMNVLGAQTQRMVCVLYVGQPAGELTFVVVIDVADNRHAMAADRGVTALLLQPLTQQIAKGF